MINQNYDDTRTKVLTENTAQGVFKHLNEMKSSGRHKRWIWELLQNARDVSPDTDDHLIAEVKYSGEELVFLHNGRGFTLDEITHLIFYGSTKIEDERSIGQYGSGFLTTHLLSWEIDVSGQLEDGNWFNFCLARKPESVKALQESMEHAWEAFKSSVKESRPESLPDSFTTQFVYPIRDPEAEGAVEAGIETLKQCTPYVVISNPQFSRININFPGEKTCFEAKRHDSAPSSVQQITVTEDTNGNSKDRQYLLAKGDIETSVIVPLESRDGGLVCQSIEEVPRLFLGFPLVGTEAFSFPAVINSFNFTPTESRNGVYLGKNDDLENNTNQAVVEEACTLLARLLQHAASAAWHHTHRWVEVPTIQGNDWVDAEWLKKCVRNKLMTTIYKTPVVLNEAGNPISMREAILPVAESDEGVEALWDLLEVWKEYPEKLPRRVEATGWCKTIENWANILGKETTEYRAGIDGSQLASQMVEKTKNPQGWGNLANLQELLRADVIAVEWLNQLYEFLRDNEFDHVISVLRFIPDQGGRFHSLSKLHRDPGIDDVLKEIAELLEWRIRTELRDLRLPSLDQEDGLGYMESDEVINKLLVNLSSLAENPNAAFKEASVSLFTWIVSQEKDSYLSNFPVFAVDGKSVLELSSADNRTPPLAPVRSWHEDLRRFEDLFPPEYILDDAFFKKVSDQEVWKRLNDLGIVRTDVITPREVTNLNILSLELQGNNEAHEAIVPFSVTDFVEREAIMDRVRNSTDRGRLFWQFITEYLIKAGSQSLKTQAIKCKSCDSTHDYYPAAWLESVRNNQWIRLDRNSRFAPDAKSLANLLRGSDWKLSSLEENHALVEFLKAIRLTPSELRLEFILNNEERDTVIQKMTAIHQSNSGNWEPFEALAKRIENDEKASENIVRILEASENELDQVVEELAERQEQQRRVTENQDLGLQVEKWVGEILEDEGFKVEPIHTGADFMIEYDDLLTLGVTHGTREWWIEVKSARTERVKMSSKQTQNALDKKENFLLCVVPIPENTDLNFETVRKNMRFIKNISKKFGDRVTELCEYIGGQEAVLINDPDDTSPGVELEGEAGKAEIRVQKSVWESDEAFRLESLKEKLR